MWSVRTSVPALLLASVLASSLGAQTSQPTLEALMSAPFPSGLTAAPAGGWVAWVHNDRGVRNIWVAGPPEYRGSQLTSYTRDDGQEMGGLTWSPDGGTRVNQFWL